MNRAVSCLFVALVGGLVAHTSALAQSSALEQNKVLAQRFHLEMIAQGKLDIADEIIAPDCVIHSPGGLGTTKGPERARQMAAGDLKAYPKGIKITHDVVFGEGDLVGFHWTFVGTRETGEERQLEGLDVVRISNGKITQMWIEYHSPDQHRKPQPQ